MVLLSLQSIQLEELTGKNFVKNKLLDENLNFTIGQPLPGVKIKILKVVNSYCQVISICKDILIQNINLNLSTA